MCWLGVMIADDYIRVKVNMCFGVEDMIEMLPKFKHLLSVCVTLTQSKMGFS